MISDGPPGGLVVDLAARLQDELIPVLQFPARTAAFGDVVADKTAEHQAFAIDDHANEMFFALLNERRFAGQVFSEEGGWRRLGSESSLLVCDPYDNTSLTFRGFRESSVVITEGTEDGHFTESVIADLQTYRIVHCSAGSPTTVLTRARDGEWREDECGVSAVRDLDQAYVAVSLMKRKRRVVGNPDLGLVREAGTLHSVDGAMMIARLALGEIDAYVDAYVGQPAYELPAMELVRRAGGVVTDEDGHDLTFGRILDVMRTNPDDRIRVVAAATTELHSQIMSHRG